MSSGGNLQEISLKGSQLDKKDDGRRNKTCSLDVGCFGVVFFRRSLTTAGKKRSLLLETNAGKKDPKPTHLVIMVNGLAGKASNWKYVKQQFLENYPNDVIVHCSETHCSTLTFKGVDASGERLAEEVRLIVKRNKHLQKISFLGHSLGGLVARYAIAMLYGKDPEHKLSKSDVDAKFVNLIVGLKPMNFITTATPHLGSKGNKQVPVFCGFSTLENVASLASRVLGRSIRQLFLTDCNEKPLLLKMANDCDELPFISALKSFKRCVAYANTRGDILVGQSTSSIRLPNELPKRQQFEHYDKYPHIVLIRLTTATPESALSTQVKSRKNKDASLQGKMINGLTNVNWERIDVRFNGIKRIAFAHSTIQVKNFCINSEGADIIAHIIDNFVSSSGS